MINKINIIGIHIANITLDDTILFIQNQIEGTNYNPTTIYTPNIDFVVKAQKDKSFKACLNDASLLIPDGKPLIWISRWFGTPLKEKVSGSSLFFKLCHLAVQNQYRIFLLGAAKGVGEQAKKNLEKQYPGILISGVYSPPTGFENDQNEIDHIISLLRQSESDILVAGFGAPKQETFIHKYKYRYQIPVSLGLGGTIDFAAGIQKMPPEWIKHAGLGWLYRLVGNPKKFWKRYIIEDLVFFKYALQQKKGIKFQ